MTPGLIVLSIFGIMLLLMVLRVPIAIAMLVAGAIGYVGQAGWLPLTSFLSNQAFARFANADLSVIPLFLLMGQLATHGGLSKALFEFASTLMGRFKGGLAMASVLACAAFGAICGSSVATAATMTSVALPEMRRHGYSGRLATGTLAAGGTLGILIPPSVPLVIYAILTEQNIAKLFAAAIIPGLIALVGYIVSIAIYVRLVPGHAPEPVASRTPTTFASALKILPIACVFLIVFGGIYGGWFTPTEGAGVGVACTLVAAQLQRRFTLAQFKQCFYATATSSAMIFMIFLGADVMNAALALSQIPAQLATQVHSSGWAPLTVVSAILLLYIVLGAVMDELSMILLTMPIFFPVVIGMDFGMNQEMTAIWFGIMVLMTVGFGMLAPPVGLNVYVVNSMAKDIPIAESYRGVVPFLISDVCRTIVLLFFPSVSLWILEYIR